MNKETINARVNAGLRAAHVAKTRGYPAQRPSVERAYQRALAFARAAERRCVLFFSRLPRTELN